MKRTIPILRSSFGGKLNNNLPTRQDCVGHIFGAACCTDKVGSSGRALHRDSEGLVLLGVGHTGRSVVRRPRAFLRLKVRGFADMSGIITVVDPFHHYLFILLG